MALIPRQCLNSNDDSDEESERLPDITAEKRHFPSSLFGIQFAMDTSQDFDFQQLLRNFDSLETYCDAPHERFYESTARCSIDVSLEEAFHFPQKISTRLPTVIGSRKPITVKNFKNAWCRLVSHYFEWVGGVPELRLIDARQRIKLVTRQLCKVICLVLAFWTYSNGYDGLFFGGGVCFIQMRIQDEILRNYLTAVTNYIHTHLISMFRRISMTREEYLFLKLIVLFEPFGVNIPPADRLIIEVALNKYRSALVGHVKRIHPELDNDAMIERITELLGVLPYLQSLSELDNTHLAHIVLQNSGNMQGRLTTEIHVNSIRID